MEFARLRVLLRVGCRERSADAILLQHDELFENVYVPRQVAEEMAESIETCG